MSFYELLTNILVIALLCFVFVEYSSTQVDNQFPGGGSNNANDGSFFFYQNPDYPRDCSEVRDSCSSSISSGVYLIKPDGYEEPFEAYCDNENDSGGWTVIQRRTDGFIDFNRNWEDYKKGFGFPFTEFWFGNEKLSFMTNQAPFELRIDITLSNGTSCFFKHGEFRISDEWDGYAIAAVGTYESELACEWRTVGDCTTPSECRELESFVDCNDVYNAGHTQDGVYSIRPAGWGGSSFDVFCNMTIDGGGWTVFQRRVDGSIDFYRNWIDYKEGFGDLQTEFWLGNEKLHYLTQQAQYEVRVDFVSSSYEPFHHTFTSFRIDDESNKYRVTDIGFWNVTGVGSSLFTVETLGFSTYDQDNDGLSYDCAEKHRGGWWYGGFYYEYSYTYCVYWQDGSLYRTCTVANLNGDYNGGGGENIFDGYYYDCNIKYTEMKIRRVAGH